MESTEEFHKKYEKEICSLLFQYLQERGHSESAKTFQKESGLEIEGVALQNFKQLVTDGNFDEAIKLIPELEDDCMKAAQIKIALYEHKYLELLQKGSNCEAIEVLRTQIVPSSKLGTQNIVQQNRIVDLTSMVMDVEKTSKALFPYNSTGESARSNLFSYLENFISPIKMRSQSKRDNGQERAEERNNGAPSTDKVSTLLKISQNNLLENLLQTSLNYQISQCKCYGYDKEESQYSLLEYHECNLNPPSKTLLTTISNHKDEIWYVSLSPDVSKLTSVSQDKMINVWGLERKENKLQIDLISCIEESHTNKNCEISCIQWHPDSTKFLVACDNIKVFNALTGECIKVIDGETSSIRSAAWVKEGEEIIFTEPEKGMRCVNANNTDIFYDWTGFTFIDIASVPNVDKFAYCSENQVGIISISSREKIKLLSVKKKIRAITMSKDGQSLLVSKHASEEENKAVIELWDINNDTKLQKFVGHTQEKFILSPIFGGKFEKYVVSGSENDKVYIWDKSTGDIVETLEGHQNVVNSIAWEDKLPNYLFSCSYDQTIKIWINSTDKVQAEIEPKYLCNEEEIDSQMNDDDSDQSMIENESELESEEIESDE
ncbi:unnamed protein product [Moneuplotes crassus]|uniref:CTLH domain-containing protein n=1 Tax=Euplotes crassus TaxID=5936 RepID=A0AAD1Y770_EUPCR|nr:unnamed protein product [Moneuplotes crassus]